MKTCTKCKIEKPETEFHLIRSCGDELRERCKLCVKEANRIYREKNKEKAKQTSRQYRENNREKINERQRCEYQLSLKTNPDELRLRGRERAKKYRDQHPSAARDATRKWIENNPEKLKESARKTRAKHYHKYKERALEYRQENKDKMSEISRLRYQANPEKYRERSRISATKNKGKYTERKKQYRQDNWPHIIAYHNHYCNNRRHADPIFKLTTSIRTTINRAITRNSQRGRAISLLGCSVKELKEHIESQFQRGMSWDNWGLYGWHIDHKIPVSFFNLTDPSQQKICFNYKNLQPLWAIDNLKKHAKVDKSSEEISKQMCF